MTVTCPRCGEPRKLSRADQRSKTRLCRACVTELRWPKWTWERIEHGTPRGYHQHRAAGVAFTDACGCRVARAVYQAETKIARTSRHRRCEGCGERRDVRLDRGNLCPPCWRRCEKAKESEFVLTGGRWVPSRNGIQVWRKDEPA